MAAVVTAPITTSRPVRFPGALDLRTGTLDLPPNGSPRAFAVFAHCVPCRSEACPAARISRILAGRGFGVLRFDIAGHCTSARALPDSTFAASVQGVVAAADWLRSEAEAPGLLVGHSLAGAAVIAAATRIPESLAVATIGAPAEPGSARGSRDLDSEIHPKRSDDKARALLVLHSPDDRVVSLDNARAIYNRARHPKSFVALDGADHLLSDGRDAEYAATLIGTWAARYVDLVDPSPGAATLTSAPQAVTVQELSVESGYAHTATSRGHVWALDEPTAAGGADSGPSPYEGVLAALGACTSMTMRMYARRKGWDYGATTVILEHSRIHAKDCGACTTDTGMIDRIHRKVVLDPRLEEDARQALLRIADRCPIHRTLSGEVSITTELAEG